MNVVYIEMTCFHKNEFVDGDAQYRKVSMNMIYIYVKNKGCVPEEVITLGQRQTHPAVPV